VQLREARRRIAELEAELATVKRATELFDAGRVVRPKAVFGIVETLAKEGQAWSRLGESNPRPTHYEAGTGRFAGVAQGSHLGMT